MIKPSDNPRLVCDSEIQAGIDLTPDAQCLNLVAILDVYFSICILIKVRHIEDRYYAIGIRPTKFVLKNH